MASKADKLRNAAGKAKVEIIKSLVRENVDVNSQDRDGCTALYQAVSALKDFKAIVRDRKVVSVRAVPLSDVKQVVGILLRAGADPNLSSEEYGSPLMLASWAGDLPVIRMLVNAGAQVDWQSNDGDSALSRAVLYPPKADVVEFLLKHGASPLLKNVEGLTVVEQAKKASRLDPKGMQPICNMVATAAANFYKNKPPERSKMPANPRPQSPLLGIKDFIELNRAQMEWSLFAVKAPADAVARAFAKFHKITRWNQNVRLKPKKGMQFVARLTVVVKIRQNPWTVVLRSIMDVSVEELVGVPKEAKAISAALKTRAISFIAEDTSSALGYQIFDSGKLVESADWENGCAFHSFSSKLRQKPALERVDNDFADSLFREEGIYVPACYPCGEGNKAWLAVDPKSGKAIERAHLMAPI